jgi:hypothetical protein
VTKMFLENNQNDIQITQCELGHTEEHFSYIKNALICDKICKIGLTNQF